MGSTELTAERLRQAKDRSGMSVKRICREAPFSERQWYAIQRGDVGLGKRKAKDLARLLDVDPGWLLGLDALADDLDELPAPRLSDEDLERLELLRELDQGSKATVDAILRLAAIAQADKAVAKAVRALVASYRSIERTIEEDELPPKKRKTGS